MAEAEERRPPRADPPRAPHHLVAAIRDGDPVDAVELDLSVRVR